MDWAQRIRSVRRENGLSQAALGKILNVSQAAVSLWEAGEAIPSPATQKRALSKLPQTASECWLESLRRSVKYAHSRCALLAVSEGATYLDCYSPSLGEQPKLFSRSDIGKSLRVLFPETYDEYWPQVLRLGFVPDKPRCVHSQLVRRMPGQVFLAEAIHVPFYIDGVWWSRTEVKVLDPITAAETLSKLTAVSALE